MLKVRFAFLSFIKFILAIACFAGLASAQQFGEGVKGWGTALQGAPMAYFASPRDACEAQFGSFNICQNCRFVGTSATDSPFVMGCEWTSHVYLCPEETGGPCLNILPTIIGFECEPGYARVAPGRCVKEVRDERNYCPAVGNPISLATGSKFDAVVDFETTDGRLRVARNYRSLRTATPRGLAGGWSFDFGMSLHLYRYFDVDQIVTVRTPDGSEYVFDRKVDGSFGPRGTDGWGLPSPQYKLTFMGTMPPDPRQVFGYSTEWRLTDEQDRVWVMQTFSEVNKSPVDFNAARPVQIIHRDGYTQNLTYGADGGLQSITDSFGRTLNFSWHNFYPSSVSGATNGAPVAQWVKTVTLPDATTINYIYDPTPSLVPPSTTYPKRLAGVERRNSSAVVVDSTQYHYEDSRFPDYLTGITDGRGLRYATYAYDALGRAVKSEHVLGSGTVDKHTIDYTTEGTYPLDFVRTVTNPLGKQTKYRFRGGGASVAQLISVEGQASANCPVSTGTLSYGSDQFVSSTTDEEGRVTQYTRDARGRPTQIIDGYGTSSARTTGITWHASLNVPVTVTEDGLTTSYVWSALGRLDSVTQTDTTTQTVPYATNGQTRTWSFTYSPQGNVLTQNGPLAGTGDTTTYTYDAQGYLKTITNPLGHVTTINTVNGRGQPTQVTDPNGVVSTYGYDAVGRLTAVIVEPGAAQAVWGLTYTGAGDVETVTTPTGLVYTMTWDQARRLSAIQNSYSERIEYTRDAMGNVTKTDIRWGTAAVLQTTTNTFDELGRQIRQTGKLSRIWKYAYDKTSNLATVTDPRNQSIGYGYDAVNRLITETERDGGITTVTYGGQNQVATYKDPRNLTTTYIRNGFGDVIRELSSDRGTTTFIRDARGLVMRITDARGVVTNFTYDNAGRILTRSYPAATTENVTYTYDNVTAPNKGKGRLTGMTDQTGTSAYVYNAKGKMTQETRVIGGQTHVTSYGWSNSGLLESITYPSGRIVTYTNNALGQVTAISTKATSTATVENILTGITYMPFGPLAGGNFGNGLTLTKTWDSDYQPDGIKVTPTAGGVSLMQRWHWFDTDFMNLSILNDNDITPAETQTFTYDAVGRLASATSTAYGTRAYTYDKVGNRLSEVRTLPATAAVTQSYTYPAASNRLTSVTQGATSVRAFTYDTAGNVTVDNRSGTAWNFTINKAGRPSSIKQGTTAKGDYTYDGRQRLATRVVSNTTGYNGTSHILHGYVGCPEPMNENALEGGSPCDRVLAETDGTGPAGTKREYIWLSDMPVAVIDKSVTPNQTYMVHADHLNRPYFMTDAARAQVWKAIYEPFGAVYSTTGTAAQTYRFPGQWFQIETSLAYNWHRHYDASLGRYVSADPIGLAAGPSLYGYVGQAPIEGTDETGLQPPRSRPGGTGGINQMRMPGYYDPLGRPALDYTPRIALPNYAPTARGLPPRGVSPPGHELNVCREGPASRPSEAARGGRSLYDPIGGEWRWFPGDTRHNPHWDYKPAPGRGIDWQNVPASPTMPPLKSDVR